MNVNEYIKYLMIEKDNLNEFELGKIFNLDIRVFSDLDLFRKEIERRVKIEEYILPEDGQIKFHDKFWYLDQNIAETTIEQWAIMSEELSQGIEINTRLVAIYFRPVGEKFNAERLNDIAEELLDMNISMFISLNKLFFYLGTKLLRNTTHLYLNQINHPRRNSLRLIKFGLLMDGIYKLKNWLLIIFYKLRKFMHFQ